MTQHSQFLRSFDINVKSYGEEKQEQAKQTNSTSSHPNPVATVPKKFGNVVTFFRVDNYFEIPVVAVAHRPIADPFPPVRKVVLNEKGFSWVGQDSNHPGWPSYKGVGNIFLKIYIFYVAMVWFGSIWRKEGVSTFWKSPLNLPLFNVLFFANRVRRGLFSQSNLCGTIWVFLL